MKVTNWIVNNINEIFTPTALWLVIWPWALDSPTGFYIGTIPPIIVGLLCQIVLTIDVFKTKTKIRDIKYELNKSSSLLCPGAICFIALLFYSAGRHEAFFKFGFYWFFASIVWLILQSFVIQHMAIKSHKD